MADLKKSQQQYNDDTQALLDLINTIVTNGELTEEDKANINEQKSKYNESLSQVNSDIDAVKNAQSESELNNIKNDILSIETQNNSIASNTQNALATGKLNSLQVKELQADMITANELIAQKANITDLNSTNATIENLQAKDVEIENLVAKKADIESLNSTNANIDTLQANKADITQLNAVSGRVDILDSTLGDINTLINGNLTSDNILALHLTAQNTTVENSFIKNAMIDNVTANKITSGTLDTNQVTIKSTDGSMILTGSVQQFKDENGKVRIQIGKDNGGNFTFILYNADGTGVLIDENGVKSSDAIADGLIVDSKIANNANISGSKLDISSVITNINNDNSTTINSSKIYLNEQEQSLEVAFNSLKTQVDTIQDVTIDGDLTSVINQVQSNTTQIQANKEGISTLVAQNTTINETISNLDGEIEEVNNTLTSKYTSLNQDLSGFKTTVADTYSTKKEVTDLEDNLETNYSTTSAMNSAINQKANEITQSVSNTYATKQSVTDINTNLTTNYSTTSAMNSAINQKANEITSTVSETYATKEEVETVDGKFDDYSTTTQMNSAIEQKATGILSTVSSTYQTKSDMANYSTTTQMNTAIDQKSDAILSTVSKSYVTNDKLNEYSTTEDMNSAINQKANEITSTVSSTYATKKSVSDVDGKFVNYSTTSDMNTAIEQKANSILSTVSETYATTEELEDIDGKFSNYSTTTQMNSAINQKANEITSTVSETYQTKSAMSSYPTTTAMNSAINQKADNILSTVSGSYATKKNVTDLENNLTTNYSTTEDMQSAIDQKADGILSTVSGTYATQSSVTNLSNNLANNYSTTTQMNSAINQKAGEITSTVSETYATKTSVTDLNTNLTNNYSTTAQMNSAISQKANEITTSVSETYTTKDEFNNLAIDNTNLFRYSRPYLLDSSGVSGKYNVGRGTLARDTLWALSGDEQCYSLTLSSGQSNAYCELKNEYREMEVVEGQTYCLSLDFAFSEYCTGINVHLYQGNTYLTNIFGLTRTTSDSNIIKRHGEKSWVATVSGTVYLTIYNAGTLDTTKESILYLDNIKFEKGNKATAWSPAPEDVRGTIDTVSDNLANNYSTTTQMNSAIQQTAESITNTVSATYTTKDDFNNLSIGGRNLLLATASSFTHNTNAKNIYALSDYTDSMSDRETVTLSFDVVATTPMYFDVYFSDSSGSTTSLSDWSFMPSFQITEANKKYHFVHTGIAKQVSRFTNLRVRQNSSKNGSATHIGSLTFNNMKLELGNKATSWTKAPEDIDTSISSVSQTAEKITWLIKSGDSASNMVMTDSALSVIADNIDLTGKVTFNSLDSSAQSKINSIESTANTASSTANTANNTANSTASTVNSWKTSGKTTINGGMIETNTITANQLSATAIDGKKITGATIIGATIKNAETNPTFQVASSGNMKIGGLTGATVNGYERAKLEVTSNGTLYSVKNASTYTKLEEGYLLLSDGGLTTDITGDMIQTETIKVGEVSSGASSYRNLYLNDGWNCELALRTTSNGNSYFNSCENQATRLGSTSYYWNIVYATNGVDTGSDRTIKENIEYLPYDTTYSTRYSNITTSDCLKFITEDYMLATYNYISDKDKKTKISAIAQDLLVDEEGNDNVIGQMVVNCEQAVNEQGTLSMNQTQLLNVAIGSIQELSKQVKEQQAIIEQQQAMINQLLESIKRED